MRVIGRPVVQEVTPGLWSDASVAALLRENAELRAKLAAIEPTRAVIAVSWSEP